MKGAVAIIVVVIVGCLALLRFSQACSCIPQHLQTHYCNSDFGKEFKIYIFFSFKHSICNKKRPHISTLPQYVNYNVIMAYCNFKLFPFK